MTVEAVNDAPELTLTAPDHGAAGAHQVDAISAAQASDIDSSQLGGATITLSGAQPNDRLDFEGYALHSENGRVMIGDTGIELVGGGYAAGTLILSGNAAPETYAAVLQSLVLESGDASGLAAGTRNISVTLRDSDGAISVPRSVEVVVDDPPPSHPEARGLTTASDAGATQDLAGSDILLLMADGAMEPGHETGSGWTEQIGAGGHATGAGSHAPIDLSQPGPDHIQPVDELQIDAARSHWT